MRHLEKRRDVVKGWAVLHGLPRPCYPPKSSRLPAKAVVVVGKSDYLASVGLRLIVEVDTEVCLRPHARHAGGQVYGDNYKLVDNLARCMLI